MRQVLVRDFAALMDEIAEYQAAKRSLLVRCYSVNGEGAPAENEAPSKPDESPDRAAMPSPSLARGSAPA
jgi:hypothetical protein